MDLVAYKRITFGCGPITCDTNISINILNWFEIIAYLAYCIEIRLPGSEAVSSDMLIDV